jgi:plastocyanin
MIRMALAVVLAAAPAVASLAADQTVTMMGSTYGDGTLRAKVGDKLIFQNDDFTDHNVFVATRGYAFDLGNQKPGDTKAYTLGKPGTFELECTVHPDMIRKVEVTQ